MEKEKEIDGILNSLDGLQKTGPGNFFFTRVMGRLQKEETGFWVKTAYLLTKPRVALVTLGFIFLLNAAAFFYQKQASVNISDQNEQVSAEDYNTTVAANSYYDENTDSH